MDYVEVRGLAKRYKENTVFQNLDFNVRKGDFVTLLGSSGCGKTTLLRCIAGLVSCDEGKIFIDGINVTEKKPKDRGIGFVFQSYALFPNMTVEENIAFGLRMQKLKKPQYMQEVGHMIELMELTGREKAMPYQLSGGQQQRVALGRALVLKPKILLLDEPLNALDAKIRKSLRMEIRNIQKKLNLTTIFVTHDQEEALIVSDRIFVMEKGRFAQSGTPEEIYTAPKNSFVAGFIGNFNVFTAEQLIQLTGKPFAPGMYAVRPESIGIWSEGDGTDQFYRMHGKIADAVVLGNIVRYNVRTGDHFITVDMLNRYKKEIFSTGESIDLSFPAAECVLLGAE